MKNLIIILERIHSDPENESTAFKSLFDYLKFEMELRIESLMYTIDDLQTNINKNIEKFKTERHQKITEQILHFSKEIEQSKPSLQTNQLKKLTAFEHQYSILDKNLKIAEKKETYETLGKLKKIDIKSSHIGYLYGTIDNFSIQKLLNIKISVEIIDVRNYMQSVCGLTEVFVKKNPYKVLLVTTDFAANDIKLFENFEGLLSEDLNVRSVIPIDDGFRRNKITQYYAICNSSLDNHNHDEFDSFFICDMELHRILIFDLSLTRY